MISRCQQVKHRRRLDEAIELWPFEAVDIALNEGAFIYVAPNISKDQ